jgi:uncharacterized RDD family membrane protein YckC
MRRLDTINHRPTPEGCELALAPAGPFSRALAWLIDLVIRLMAWLALAQGLMIAGRAGMGAVLLSGFVLEWLAPICFEVLWYGQTPGKRVLGLTVLHDDGTPVGWQASFIRNTVRFVDFLPLGYAAGFVTMLINADGKRLGDLVAGTIVVHAPRKTAALTPTEVGVEVPPFPLLPDERRAVVEYAQRVGTLTDERSLELATLPVALVAGLSPTDARARLLRIANFLLGQH